MMNKYLVIVIIGIFGSLAFDYWRRRQTKINRNRIMDHILYLMRQKKYQDIYKYLETDECKINLPAFNIFFIKMNIALINEDDKAVEKLLNSLDITKCSKKQKEEVYLKAFMYFCRKGDKKASFYKNEILNNTMNNEKKLFVERMYNIFYEKGYSYLEDILKETEQIPEQKRIGNYMLIQQMYLNKNNTSAAEKYGKLITELNETNTQ